ncbi:MAG: fluoride efflux transporter CrcB [Alphaproteobacteria bacterium]|nr:MAG: fluoride efflux transporter CrcB [Alphaproteobacteria bacterium]
MSTFAPATLLAIFAGAGVGGVVRHGLSLLVGRLAGTAFPYGTLCVNIVGGFILGLLVGWWAGQGVSPQWRAFLVTGVLGGFTTFSAFTLETVTLIERHQTTLAFAYIAASVTGALLALAAGLWLSRL